MHESKVSITVNDALPGQLHLFEHDLGERGDSLRVWFGSATLACSPDEAHKLLRNPMLDVQLSDGRAGAAWWLGSRFEDSGPGDDGRRSLLLRVVGISSLEEPAYSRPLGKMG